MASGSRADGLLSTMDGCRGGARGAFGRDRLGHGEQGLDGWWLPWPWQVGARRTVVPRVWWARARQPAAPRAWRAGLGGRRAVAEGKDALAASSVASVEPQAHDIEKNAKMFISIMPKC